MNYDDPDKVTTLLRNRNPDELDSYLQGIANLPTLAGKLAALLSLRIPHDTAKRRAAMVVEDMNRIGFKLKFDIQIGNTLKLHANGLPVPIQYFIQNTDWTVNRKEPSHALEGSHLNRGDLLRLSKVCEVGRRLIPNEWPARFRKELTNPLQHLDALNEVWWLSKFVHPTNIQKPDRRSTNKPSPDWCFSVQQGHTPVQVNLEVKRRCGDIKRYLGFKNRTDLFDDIAKKFPDRSMTGINVGAVTMYSAIDDEIERHTRQWITDNPTVDAVILWSEQSSCSSPQAFVTRGESEFPPNDWLCPPDEEDASGVAILKHLIPHYPGLPCAR